MIANMCFVGVAVDVAVDVAGAVARRWCWGAGWGKNSLMSLRG